MKCHNYQKYSHVAYECCLPEKNRFKGEEKENLSQEEDSSSLMMAISGEHGNGLLKGVNGDFLIDNLWYLDTGATSHMTDKISFFLKGIVRFDNQSSIKYEDKGDLLVNSAKGVCMTFLNVLFMPHLMINIRILGKLDNPIRKTILKDEFIAIHEKKGIFLL